MAPKCSSGRKSHTSLTLSQKLEMIKLSEEGMSKARTGLCECKGQVLEGNLK